MDPELLNIKKLHIKALRRMHNYDIPLPSEAFFLHVSHKANFTSISCYDIYKCAYIKM